MQQVLFLTRLKLPRSPIPVRVKEIQNREQKVNSALLEEVSDHIYVTRITIVNNSIITNTLQFIVGKTDTKGRVIFVRQKEPDTDLMLHFHLDISGIKTCSFSNLNSFSQKFPSLLRSGVSKVSNISVLSNIFILTKIGDISELSNIFILTKELLKLPRHLQNNKLLMKFETMVKLTKIT